MEELLRELIAVNREMLNELKQLREAMGQQSQAVATPPAQAAPAEPSSVQPGTRSHPARYTPEDLEDIHGSLLEGLKKRNKEKSNAFSEFEKRHKNW